MKQLFLIALTGAAFVTLSACKEDVASLPQAIDMTEEATGYYCQMDLLNHDGPKGQIHLAGMPAPIFFSQVKDAVAYLHMPEQNYDVVVAYVQDMGGAKSWAEPGAWMPMRDAIFVIGSDQMGGMDAPEFVPFSDETAAAAFMAKHGGALRGFDEITAADALSKPEDITETSPQSDIAGRLRALSREYGTN